MPTKSKSNQATEDLQAALEAALASGLTQGDIVSMVAGALKDAEEVGCQAALPNFPTNGKPKVYTELPPGLITLPDAAKKFDIPKSRIREWALKGQIKTFGRLRGRAPGGGFLVLMEEEVAEHIKKPLSKGGRPKKT